MRRDDAELRTQFDPTTGAGAGWTAGRGNRRRPPPDRNLVPANQVAEQLDQFLVSAGAVARVNDAGRDHGQIRAFNNRTFDVAKAVPTVVLRNEDYGRLSRLRGRRLRGGTRTEHRQSHLPGGAHVLQRGGGDSGHRQGAGSGDARRPPRFVARGNRCDRQRDWLRDDARSRFAFCRRLA